MTPRNVLLCSVCFVVANPVLPVEQWEARSVRSLDKPRPCADCGRDFYYLWHHYDEPVVAS